MSRLFRPLLTLGLLLSVGWNVRQFREKASLRDDLQQARDERAQLQAKLGEYDSRGRAAPAPAPSPSPQDLDALKQELANQQALLEPLEAHYNRLRNGGLGGSEIPALKERLEQKKRELAELLKELAELKPRVAAARSKFRAASEQDHAVGRQTGSNLDAQISVRQQQLQGYRDELAAIRQNMGPKPDNPTRERIHALAAQIQADSDLLKQLRDQKNLLNGTGNPTTAGLQAAASQLASAQSGLEQRIAAAQQEVQQLGIELSSSNTSLGDQRTELKLAEQLFQAQKQKVEALRAQLKQTSP